MAANTPWSDDELAYLAEHGIAAFLDRYPGLRSYDAVRVKHGTLKRDAAYVPGRTGPLHDVRQECTESGTPWPDEPAGIITHAKPDPAEDDLESLFTSLERADAIRPSLSPTEHTTRVIAPDDLPTGVAFMSDIHAGASGVDYARFRSDLDVIANTDGLYTIINGDLLENAKVMSKAGNALYHAAFANPREQYLYVRTRLSTIKGKILAILAGNHDSRDAMYAGIDRLPELCRYLDVPYATEAGMTVYLTVAGHTYTIVAKHDYGGKSNITKTNSARRLWTEWPHSWQTADVIALAHLHECNVSMQYQRGQEVVWLRSGAYKIHDEYALSKGYKSTYGVPIVVFWPRSRKMVAFMDFDEGVKYLRMVRGEARAA